MRVTAAVAGQRYTRTAPVLLTYSAARVAGPRRSVRHAGSTAAAAGFAGSAARQPGSDADAAAQVGLRAYLGYLAVAFILAVALSWSYSTTARLGYRIDELRTRTATLQGQNERLSYELSGYESMARVEREALGLGMVRPEYVRATRDAGVTGAGSEGAAASAGVGQVAVRVIRLGPTGAGDGSSDAVVAAAPGKGSGGLGSLWERFYRWLTGVSQAEARDWQ